jgi:hypothetical protein
MTERRTAPRSRVLKTGRLVLSERAPKLECTIRNLSATGALLQVSSTFGIPADFDLFIGSERRSCRVVWRTDSRLGVAFR